jgi:branched-chain amino acid transport system permease protein
MKRFSTVLPVLGMAVVVVATQVIACGLGRPFYLTQLIMAAYYSIVVMGLCLVMGYCGQVSLGHGAFFALGGYTSAILTTRNFAGLRASPVGDWMLRTGLLREWQNPYGEQLLSGTPAAAFVVALLLTGAIALLVGYPALRLKGQYLAMATLGFGLIVYRILLGSEFSGSADGITGVPPWRIAEGLVIASGGAHRVANYYFAWAVTLATAALLLNLVHSRVGRALRAIHEGETAANAMGVNTAAVKLQAFVLSAMLAALAGSLFTHYTGGIGPSEAGAMKSVRYVALVAAGGMANIVGCLVVGTLLNVLSLRGCFGTLDHAVFGAILIAIVSFAPEGPLRPLGAWLRRAFSRRPGKESGHASA